MRLSRLLPLVLAVPLAGCAVFGYTMVQPDRPVAVAGSDMTVTAPVAWNRAGATNDPGKDAELWTLDGPALNEITFYGAVPDGRPLFREVDRRDRPLPRFSSTMLPPDVAALFESSYRVASGTPLFQLGAMEPATFAGHPGFRFAYAFTLQGEEVRRRGEATGAIVDGALYLISFEAPEIHYFDRDVATYRRIAASAAIPAAAAPGSPRR